MIKIEPIGNLQTELRIPKFSRKGLNLSVYVLKKCYPENSSLMVISVEKLNDVGSSNRTPRLPLVLEDGQPGNGERRRGFEL